MTKKNNRKLLEDLAGPLTFGGNLKSIRLCDEMIQAEFAAKLGVSVQHLCNVENGHKAVSPDRAKEWARLLGYSEVMFVKLAIEDQLRRNGMDYEVTLKKTD